jgi:hypothetical protein
MVMRTGKPIQENDGRDFGEQGLCFIKGNLCQMHRTILLTDVVTLFLSV